MTRRDLVAAAAVAMFFITAPAGFVFGEVPAPNQEAESSTSLVGLNTATGPELEALPGVGPALAARIIEYREANGGFKKLEDLMNVRGIGERTFLRLRPLVSVTAAGAEGGAGS